ncbi:hypothetical protein NDU88_003928 [Pleurodeles waltl]|uniref:Uncharacterized protein n=1 Tax=Pleurodeles waltl TaxID=8319 RepID=A0AAV7T7N8_PLEWA|nr:hypothetical protein NDU88_003928 [Pleurodeles waltl]
MRVPKARHGIPQRGEKNCVARSNFTSQDPVGGVRGRSPERERIKRNVVSRNAWKRTVLPRVTSHPRILLVECEGGAQNASV